MNAVAFVLAAVTWPVWAAIALFGGGAATAGTMWWKRRKQRSAVNKDLQRFKSQVVEISDTLDALQHRHKMLPFTDDDFTAPMAGQTLAEYENVQDSLNLYRERWLKLMDIWDASQKIVEEGGKQEEFEQAQAMLKNVGLVKELEDIRRACEQPLDGLAEAHEIVHAALAAMNSDGVQIKEHLEKLQSANIHVARLQRREQDTLELINQGQSSAAADPIGAMEFLQQARTRVDRLLADTSAALQNLQLAAQLEQTLAELDDSVSARQREGHLFAEPNASPIPHLDFARERLQSGQDQLTHGDIDQAAQSLAAASEATSSATDCIAAAERMRRDGANELAARRHMLNDLDKEITAARLTLSELERNFAAESWLSVADNADHAAEMTAQLQQSLADAEQALAPDVQHYARADRVLQLVDRQAPEINEVIQAIRNRLDELTAIRMDCESRHTALQTESRALNAQLQQHQDDRPLSNHRYDLARKRLEDVSDRMARGATNWQFIHQHLQYCADDFEQVRHLLEEDLRKAQEARSEIAEADSEIRRIRSFYQSGISADVTKARLRLNDAQRSLERQEYERSVEIANAAEQIARDIHDDAIRRAEEREREQRRIRQQERMRQIGSFIEVAGSIAAQVAISHLQNRNRRRRR